MTAAAQQFLTNIRAKIARNELADALQSLRELLDNSPHLDEAIVQSARFHDIRKQIRLGLVSDAEADITQNQIRAGLLELLRELEERGETPAIRAEMERAVASIVNSKNSNTGTASAGRDIQFGDRTENHHHYPDGRKIPKLLTTAPFDPPYFIGRDEELEQVRQKISSGQNLLMLVNGEGGMGKTSFAAKYWLQYADQYRHLAFLYVGGGMTDALLSMRGALGLNFSEAMPSAERLRHLLQALANLDAPCLLVLDNANDPAELEQHFAALRQLPNCHLLLTSRVGEMADTHAHKIGPLPDNYPLQLFKHHYPEFRPDDEAQFWDIHRSTGGNTLVLEVLAKNLREINQNDTFYPLAQLWQDIQSRQLLRLSEQAKVKVPWQGMEKNKPEALLAAMFDLRPLAPQALRLMSQFAALPPDNISFADLKSLLRPEAPRQLSDTLTDLYRLGWLERHKVDSDTKAFKISPVVQEVLRHQQPDWERDCLPMVNILVEELDFEKIHLDNYRHSTVFVRYAEAVVDALQAPDYDVARLCQNIGNFHAATGDLGKTLQAYQKMASIQTALLAAQPDSSDFKSGLGWANQFLGNTYSSLGNLSEALTFFEKMSSQFEALHKAYPQNVQFKNGLAISYAKLGETHTDLGDLPKALTFFEERSRLGKELHEAYPQNVNFKNGLAISYQFLGSTHADLGDLHKALTFFEKDIELSKALHEAYPQNVNFKNGLAISYEKLGSINL